MTVSEHILTGKMLYLAVADAAAKGNEGLGGDPMVSINEGVRTVTKFMASELPQCPACEKACPLVGISSTEEMYEGILKNYMLFSLMISATSARVPELLDGFMLAAGVAIRKLVEKEVAP